MIHFFKRKFGLLMVCLLLSVFPMTVYAEDNTGTYVSGTKINRVGVAGMTPEEAKTMVESFYNGTYNLTIRGKDQKEAVIQGKDIGYHVELTGDLTGILTKQNEEGRISGPSVDHSYELSMTAAYDEAALADKLASLPMVTQATDTSDAYISAYQEGAGFTIVPEVQGTEIDMEKLTAAVKEALGAGSQELDLGQKECYVTIQTYADNEMLVKQCEAMNRSASMNVTYLMGSEKEVLEGPVIASWIVAGSGEQVTVDREKAAAYVRDLAAKYDTAGTTRTFHTSRGTDVALTGPYGWKIDQAAETEALIGAILAGESLEREPVYSSTAASRDGNDYGTTYVEADIAAQHVYFYQDGQLVWDSPCVTGNLSKNYGTPDGIYGLYYKQQDKVLRGPKQADGTYEYESPVKYWMPFNGGIGFHDANWRSKFGGEIYKTNGSHGCVNLPPEKAKILYDYLYKNVPVICHS